MENLRKNSTITILIISLLLFGLMDASTTHQKNEAFDHNDFFIKEKTLQAVELLVNLIDKMPINDIAIVLSNFVDGEDDIKDIIHSTIKSEPFLKIIGYLKVFIEESSPFFEIYNKISAKQPAMAIEEAAKKLFRKKVEVMESFGMDGVTQLKLLFNSKTFRQVRNIQHLATDITGMDKEFIIFANYLTDNFPVIEEAIFDLALKIGENKILRHIATRQIIKTSYYFMEGIFITGQRYMELFIFGKQSDGMLPEFLSDRFFEDFDEAARGSLSYFRNNERVTDFLAHMEDEEVLELLMIAWLEASFEEKKNDFGRGEL